MGAQCLKSGDSVRAQILIFSVCSSIYSANLPRKNNTFLFFQLPDMARSLNLHWWYLLANEVDGSFINLVTRFSLKLFSKSTVKPVRRTVIVRYLCLVLYIHIYIYTYTLMMFVIFRNRVISINKTMSSARTIWSYCNDPIH